MIYADFHATSLHNSLETGLGGWRGSAVCPLLCSISLLTGNFTGNFAKLGHSGAPETKNKPSFRGFRWEFPTQRNRELFSPNSEPYGENREFYRPELKLLPDAIFGTKDLWEISALPRK